MKPFNKILLYDGDCGFCQNIVLWVYFREKKTQDHIYFAPLSSELGQNLLSHHQLPGSLESVVFIENGKAYIKSRAVFRICSWLTFPFSLGKNLTFFPVWLADFVYDIVARLRKRLTAKKVLCDIPDAGLRERLVG